MKQYRTPHHLKPILDKEIEKMLKNNQIQESTSCFNSPIIILRKKSIPGQEQRYRVVFDARALNKKTKPPAFFPLPQIVDLIDRLAHAKYFTKIDLHNAYY